MARNSGHRAAKTTTPLFAMQPSAHAARWTALPREMAAGKRPVNRATARPGNVLTQTGQDVCKADLRGDVSVHGEFGDFSVDKVHAGHRGAVLAHASIQGFQHRARAPVRFSDQQKIGIEEVTDHAPERDKFRAVAQAEIGAGAFTAGSLKSLTHFATG